MCLSKYSGSCLHACAIHQICYPPLQWGKIASTSAAWLMRVVPLLHFSAMLITILSNDNRVIPSLMLCGQLLYTICNHLFHNRDRNLPLGHNSEPWSFLPLQYCSLNSFSYGLETWEHQAKLTTDIQNTTSTFSVLYVINSQCVSICQCRCWWQVCKPCTSSRSKT